MFIFPLFNENAFPQRVANKYLLHAL